MFAKGKIAVDSRLSSAPNSASRSRVDLNIVYRGARRATARSRYYYRKDPREMQGARVPYRPVKGEIHGNLFDHKQTLGYTGHWAVLSERRSNTVNTCAHVARPCVRVYMCVRVDVLQRGESGASVQTNVARTDPPPPPAPRPPLSRQRSHAPRPRRGPRAFYLTSTRSRVQTPKRANARARACTPNGR